MLLGGVNVLENQIPAEIWFAQARETYERLTEENEAFEASFPLKCKLELKFSIWWCILFPTPPNKSKFFNDVIPHNYEYM